LQLADDDSTSIPSLEEKGGEQRNP